LKYLVDTNVISEIRKGARAHAEVVSWWNSVENAQLHLSVLSLGEIRQGVLSIMKKDSGQARNLGRWLTGLPRFFSQRLVPIDEHAALIWGEINCDRTLPTIDSLLAASALSRNMVLVTRNTRDIDSTGVKFLNPFKN